MNPIFVRHRINDSKLLTSIDPSHGVEIDIRALSNSNQEMYLAHDPWTQGESLESWLKEFKKIGIKGPILLNTKEDGLEKALIVQMKKHQIANFIFIDTCMPTLIKLANEELYEHLSVRLSINEKTNTALEFKQKVKWVWVDSFKGAPMNFAEVEELKKYFKVSLVSPELHTGNKEMITQFGGLYKLADLICTKNPEFWLHLN